MFFGHEIVNVELLDEVEQGAVREMASSVRYDGIILITLLPKCTHQGRKL